jgi:NADH dehydrogenase
VHPEFARDASGVKTIDQALELRSQILRAFEMAERETDPAARRRWLTFVVVGAGPTGVELAGHLVELSRRLRRGNLRRIDPGPARVVLLGAAPTILPAFPEGLRDRAARDLRALGVEIHVGTVVTGVDEQGINTTRPSLTCAESMRRRRSGRPVSERRASVASSPTSPASSSIEPDG